MSILSWDDLDDDSQDQSEEAKKLEEGFKQAAPVPQACSIDNPDCEACQ